MTTILIKGETSDAEPLELMFTIPSCYETWPVTLLTYAKAALWDARWIPGSVAWQCFTVEGVPLPVGENYK